MPVSAAIDSTNRLGDERGHVLDLRAPTIPIGVQVTGAMVRQAEREHKRRKLMSEASVGNDRCATVDE
eukprot:scaffold462056_cov55-Attheya_sp.AAC.1